MAKIISWKEKIQSLEELLRQGKLHQVKEELMFVKAQKPPRDFLFQLCNLARRSGHPLLGSQLLSPLFNNDKNKSQIPNTLESSAYAACLSALGAHQEAFQILAATSEPEHTEVLLQKAFIHIRNWEHSKVIPILRKYLQSSAISPYQNLVAHVNLLAAYLFNESFASFEKECIYCIKLAQKLQAKLLLSNILEIRAQYYISQKKFFAAENNLNLSAQLLSNQETLYHFFIERWKLFLSFDKLQLAYPFDASAQTHLHNLRNDYTFLQKKASRLGYWEVARDCDYQFIIRTKSHFLQTKLFYGTPYVSYRAKLVTAFDEDFQIPARWTYFEDENMPSEQKIILHPSANDPLTLKLLSILLLDLYKPLSIGFIFTKLFPDERFSPEHSSHRVNQLLYRLKKELSIYTDKNKNSLVSFQVKNHLYQIQSSVPIEWPNPVFPEMQPLNLFKETILKGKLGATFNLQKAQDYFQSINRNLDHCPLYLIKNILKDCAKENKIQRIDQGPKTIYRLISPIRKAI